MSSTTDIVIQIVIAALTGIALFVLARKDVKRSGGKDVANHAIFGIAALILILALPLSWRMLIFSPIGLRVVGTVVPVYESVLAISTPELDDDKLWLQYWISQGIIFYSSEWILDLASEESSVYLYFVHFTFLFFLWLQLPYTDGAALIFDKITKPIVAPLIMPLTENLGSWMNALISSAVSISHIWVLWAVFVFFPPGLKRFITISVATIYPIMASITAAITDTAEDDTFWLTYWSCFGCLYLIVDWLEAFLGNIPGFYLLVLFCVAYLMIPAINGAEKVFRNVLVPLTGTYEMLIYRDALLLKRNFMKKIPSDRSAGLNERISSIFSANDEKDKKPLKKQISSFFEGGSEETQGLKGKADSYQSVV